MQKWYGELQLPVINNTGGFKAGYFTAAKYVYCSSNWKVKFAIIQILGKWLWEESIHEKSEVKTSCRVFLTKHNM